MRAITRLIPNARHATILTAQTSIEWRASVLPKSQALVFPGSQPRWTRTLTRSWSL